MKQYLIAIAMVLALSTNANATAQKHRHTPRTEQVSDTVKHNQDAIEAFSDTTATNNANADDNDNDSGYRHHVVYEGEDAERVVSGIFGDMDGAAFMGLLIPILAIVCVGFLLPVILVLLVFYFINRNRKEKYRLAEMAIKNGQPIPDALLKDAKSDDWDSTSYNAGIRQMFTGVGLAIFLGIVAGEVGFGIGALVFFIGLGKWYIARQDRNNRDNNQTFNNNNNIQNYE
ncbi:hypothetical protein SAMN05216462_3161 [Xylanibacter ruminicola]|uniref:DUF6249 domain-containing protein n=1 Tax=Xylanibacter ruminicola TaxID=839 RepID=A0A1H4F699_XYLRU|nr:DUF6249 domain-containing protein [Xylanibacter ruminicola]SEA92885.1 hypothetical protein SAMN05216462_3161 [Xylanibacter ruminicola]